MTGFAIEHMEAERYLVGSLKNTGNIHLVDMEEFDGYGECSCEYWHFNLGAKLKAGKKPFKRCRHIRAVMNHVKKDKEVLQDGN